MMNLLSQNIVRFKHSQSVILLKQEMMRNYHGTKRIFGRDITNLEPRRAKNASISEKPALVVENRQRARSFERRVVHEHKEAITQYQQQIVAFMLKLQHRERNQKMTHISDNMRQILVDWLVDVHHSFQLKEQTLYLTLAYLNAYTSHHDVTKHDYQLVGVTCLWIASKYEQIYPPRMQNYIQVTDCSYTVQELKAMEGKILLTLNFDLNAITPLALLDAASDKWHKDSHGKLTRQSQRTYHMCKYLLELALFQNIGKEYCMKTLVLSASMLADSVLKVKTESTLLESPRMEKDILMKCFKEMCLALQNASRNGTKLRAIKKKYSEEKYFSVARFRIEHK